MLNDKVVIVTGGAGLLGSRFCRAIAAAGGVSIVADRDLVAAQRTAADIASAFDGRAEAAALDIGSAPSIRTLVADVAKRHGRIDALVNNAYPRNANYGRKLEDVLYADFCENVGLHLGGYFQVSQQFCLYFREQGHGNIVNIGSIYGTMAPRFEVYADTMMTMPVEYAAIKSALLHLTRYFAQYFKHHGIRANMLSPGGILDRQPEPFIRRYNAHCGAKGMLDPSDLVGTLVYLLSDASAYVTGQNIIVDDGFAL